MAANKRAVRLYPANQKPTLTKGRNNVKEGIGLIGKEHSRSFAALEFCVTLRFAPLSVEATGV
jgi:hypothetical protein